MNLPWLTSVVASFVRVIGSTVVGEHGAVLLGGEGVVGDVDDPLGDGSSDKFSASEQYGPIIWRPRPPSKVAGKTISTEGIGLRLGGSTVPIALRDLRLNRSFPNPKPGSIALPGYGGAFLAFDDTPSLESRATLYVPYAYSGGVPSKAHSITLDPVTRSINILHADGGQVVLLPDKEVMVIADDDTWLQLKPGKFAVQAETITLAGTVIIGNPDIAAPLVGGPATLPSTRLLYSQT